MRPDVDPLLLATDLLGTPFDLMSVFDNSKEVRTATWRIYDDFQITNLTMAYVVGSDLLEMTFSVENQNPEHVMFGSFQRGSTVNRIQKFVEQVRKPWELWTEEEILSELAWIVLYKEDMGVVTDVMHSRMVLESYRDLNNKWVKRYFKS